jgi:hypothetical protein
VGVRVSTSSCSQWIEGASDWLGTMRLLGISAPAHITVSGWSVQLEEAAQSFVRLSTQQPVAGDAVALAQLGRALSTTAKTGLDRLSRELRSILSGARISGIPLPDDEDWSF